MTKVVDLTNMPSGLRYEDTYGDYIKIFEDICMTPGDVEVQVIAPPASWVSLLLWLDCEVVNPQVYFENDAALLPSVKELTRPIDRTVLEAFTCLRPETVHSLYLVDMEWNHTRKVPQKRHHEFVVTNNGSYHRNEVLDYFKKLEEFEPIKRKVVIVPCAADKPYPSALHQAVLDILPHDYYLMNATGVLGLVPRDLWDVMPFYDSGIPNDWRLFRIAKEYFAKFPHEKIVVYCDYYNESLFAAFQALGILDRVVFINEVKFYANYLDLLEPERIGKLNTVLNG